METIYYIYHIPSVKIGVSTEPDKRVARQGFWDYEILETHTCIMKVSEREQELQRQYGYKVDDSPYWKINKMAKTGEGGRTAAGKGSRKRRYITFEDAQMIRELYSTKKYKQKELGQMYNVSRTLIAMITLNKRYTQP